jgi:hypothetical protein
MKIIWTEARIRKKKCTQNIDRITTEEEATWDIEK